MWKKTLGILLIFALAAFLPAQQQESSIHLSLEDCIVKAMKYNLGVAINVLTPENRTYALRMANEKFLPSFSVNFFLADQQQAFTPSSMQPIHCSHDKTSMALISHSKFRSGEISLFHFPTASTKQTEQEQPSIPATEAR